MSNKDENQSGAQLASKANGKVVSKKQTSKGDDEAAASEGAKEGKEQEAAKKSKDKEMTAAGSKPPADAEPGEVSDDDEEAAVNVIVKDRPSMSLEGGRAISANHVQDSGGHTQTGQDLLTSRNTNATANTAISGVAASAAKAGAKTGVDINDSGNINGVATIDFNMAGLSDDDKPWKKPGADITDYFNYGFTEESWMAYSEQQRILRAQFGGMNIPVASTNLSNSNVKVVTHVGGDRGPVFRSGGQLMGRGHDRGGVGSGTIGVIGSIHRENRRMGGGREAPNGIDLGVTGMSIPTAGGAGAYAPQSQAGGGPGVGPGAFPNMPPVGRSSAGNAANFSVPPPSFHVPPPGLPHAAPFLHPAALAAAVSYGAPPHDLFSVPPPGGPMPPVPWDASSSTGGPPGPHPPGSLMDSRERTPDSIRSEEEAKLAETQAEILERDMRGESQRRDRGERGYRSHRDRDRDRDRDRERDRDRDRERDRIGRSPRPGEREYGRERGIGRYEREREYGREREHRNRYRSRSRSRSRDRMRSSGRSKRSRYAVEEEARYPPAVGSRRHAKRSRRSSRSRSHSPASLTGGRTGSGHRSSRPTGLDSPPLTSRRRGGALSSDVSAAASLIGLQDGGDSPDGQGLLSSGGIVE